MRLLILLLCGCAGDCLVNTDCIRDAGQAVPCGSPHETSPGVWEPVCREHECVSVCSP